MSPSSYATRLKYLGHLKNHIEPAFGKMMLGDMADFELIQKWLDAKGAPSAERNVTRRCKPPCSRKHVVPETRYLEPLLCENCGGQVPAARRPGLSWATRADLRNILSSMFKQATMWRLWVGENPIKHVTAGRAKPVREKRKLTIEQTRRLLALLPYDVRIVCSVCLLTARISEAMGLQEKHLNFTERIIEVRQRYYRGDLDVVKSRASKRDLPMGYLEEDLRRLCKGDPERYIFQIETQPKWGHRGRPCSATTATCTSIFCGQPPRSWGSTTRVSASMRCAAKR
jgi:integrase